MFALRPSLLLLPAAIVLTGCAVDPRYPSLARRDAERVEGSALPAAPEDQRPETPAPPPAGLGEQLAAIGAEARAAHAQFLRRAAAARNAAQAARGAAVASDRWADAIVAISDVESARSDTMFSLAELDSMLAAGAVAQAATGEPQGLPEITALREEVAALVEEEDAILGELTGPVAG